VLVDVQQLERERQLSLKSADGLLGLSA
jgi:hypothetical protein